MTLCSTPLKPLRWRGENPKACCRDFFLMWHLIQPLKGPVGCRPAVAPLPPTRTCCSPQAKSRWVHVKDHMTIGIPDPARERE